MRPTTPPAATSTHHSATSERRVRPAAGPAVGPWVWVLRRLVVAPAVVGLTVAVWVTLPLWLLAAAALSPLLPGRWRALRLFWVAVALPDLRVAAAGGAARPLAGQRLRLADPVAVLRRHPLRPGAGRLMVFFREARRVLALRIRTDGPHPPRVPEGPVLVMCRHAGPGDSFILMYALMHWYAREPRVVLKDTLAWDPAIDVVLRRHPGPLHLAQPARRARTSSRRSRALATRPRRQRRVRDLPRGRQLHPAAPRAAPSPGCASSASSGWRVRAEEMTHVLAPRPGGLLAALDGGTRRRRRDGGAHRARPPADGRRRVARAADGQADHHALVAGAARGDPRGPRGADRVALRLVGARSTAGSRRTGSTPSGGPASGTGSVGGPPLDRT